MRDLDQDSAEHGTVKELRMWMRRYARAYRQSSTYTDMKQASSENRSASKQKQDSEDSLLDMIGSYQNKTSDGAGGKSAEAASMSKNAKIFKKK